MIRILIFSDNKALIKLWSSALTPTHQFNQLSDINADFNADAVIIDTNKVDTTENIFSIFNTKKTRFLIVGTNWSEENQIKALVNGAAGYCGESEPVTLLLQAIDSILKGDMWIQRHLVPRVIGTLVQMNYTPVIAPPTPQARESSSLINTLSNRELDVATMVRGGNNNKVIASNLNISERTVKAHLTSIFKKLNVSDRLHLALFIREFG